MRLRLLSAIAIMILCLMYSKQTWAQKSTITHLPSEFTAVKEGYKEWEILSDSSLFLFSHPYSSNANKIWLQQVGGPVIYFWNPSDAPSYSYKTSEQFNRTISLTFDRGPVTNIVCDFSSCKADTLPAKLGAQAWMYYYSDNDLRSLWNDQYGACSYSYHLDFQSCLTKKLDWLDKLAYRQKVTSAQSTAVLSSVDSAGNSKNQIIDLTKGVVTSKIWSYDPIEIKLNGNGRLWYAYNKDIFSSTAGVTRAGLADDSEEFNFKDIESQINSLMREVGDTWKDRRSIKFLSIESSLGEASLVLLFNQFAGDAQYLALYDIKTKKVSLFRDAKGVIVTVGEIAKLGYFVKLHRQTNRLYALTGQNIISIWDLNKGSFVKNVQSSLKNIDDLRVTKYLYLIDFKNGQLERLNLEF